MREGADIFEMAAVGDDGDFHFVGVGCFYHVPQAFRKHNGFAANDVQADSKNTLTAEMLTNVRKYFLYVVRIAPNFDGLVPLGKAEFALIVAGFGDVPVDDDEFFGIHKLSSQVCGEWLGDDDTGLDEKLAKVAVVIAPEVREGAWIAWCGGNDKAFFGPLCQVAQDYMLCMPSQGPAAAFQHCVAHFVDFGVI